MANKNEIEYYGETTQYSLSINGIKKTGTLIKCENTYYFCYNVENNKYCVTLVATEFQYSGKQFYLPINEITYYNFDSSSLKDVMIDDNHNEVVFKCIDFYSKTDEFYVAVNFNDKCFYMIENNKREIIG